MKTLQYLTAALITSTLLGCSQPLLSVKPHIQNGQSEVYEDGQKIVISQKLTTVITSINNQTIQKGERVSVAVAIINSSEHPVTLLTENISAYDANGSKLEIPSSQELKESVRAKDKWKRVGLALQEIAAGGNDTTTTHHQGNIGGTYYRGTTTTTDSTKSSEELREIRQARAINNANTVAAMNAVENSLLKNQTLAPNETYNGIVWITPPQLKGVPPSFSLEIVLAGETHNFKFTQTLLTK